MRVVAHLVSVMLLVPGIIIAAVILAIGHVTGQADFGRFVNALLDVLLAFFPLAFLAVVVWFVIAVLGFSRRWYRAAAICVAAVAAGTSLVIAWPASAADALDHWGVLVPGGIALIIGIWLASTEWPQPPRPKMTPAPTRIPPSAT